MKYKKKGASKIVHLFKPEPTGFNWRPIIKQLKKVESKLDLALQILNQ